MATRIFISYSSRDRAEALDLKTLFEHEGCDVWLDIFDIRPTGLLSGELAQNVEQADVVCLLLSPTSVASRWVSAEIDHALARSADGLRILPLILRSCAIPEALANFVGIDATAGIDDEVVRLRLARWIRGEEAADDHVLLDAARRSLLAAEEKQERADRAMAGVSSRLDAVRGEPIRSLTISLEADSFPESPGAVLELRLTFDRLFSQPMSVYFARFREGATWPEEFGLPEPSYRSFFGRAVARIQASFRWFDRVQDLAQTIDGTDLGDLPATWELRLDGEEFLPGGAGIHLPQRFELPPLARLTEPDNGFELIVHDSTTRTASQVDPSRADVDLVVTGGYSERDLPRVTLFHTRHARDELAILGAQSFREVSSSVEREALLGLYVQTLEPAGALRAERVARVEQLLSAGGAETDEERSLAARLSVSRANLAAFRAQHRDALSAYMTAANLLQPAVLEGRAPYRDRVLLYQACANVVAFFLSQGSPADAAEHIDVLLSVAGRLCELDPEEPDYRRLRADALHKAARAYAGAGRREDAAAALVEHVETFRSLVAETRTADRVEDAMRALADAVGLAAEWDIGELVPADAWRAEVDPGNSDDEWDELALEARSNEPPVWLRPAELDGWPTHAAGSELLRYELRVRDGWSDPPQLASTGREIEHVYRGPSPAEWLVITFMDGADASSNMRNWVEAHIAISGFPVLEMQVATPDSPPELIEWRYEGRDEQLAERLAADEAHRYQGIATLRGPAGARLARLYVVMARRAALAWKFALSFETACPPGVPEQIVDANDHVRAGATFGSLRLL